MADTPRCMDQLTALEARLGASAAMVSAFDGELARMRESMVFTGREVNTLSTGIGGGLAPRLRRAGVRRDEAVGRAEGRGQDHCRYGLWHRDEAGRGPLGGPWRKGVAGVMGVGHALCQRRGFSQGR
jgi:hypothetical protein